MNDLVYSLGDLFVWTFGILEGLGNLPNIIFTLAIMAGLAAWLMRQQKYLKEDRSAGRII